MYNVHVIAYEFLVIAYKSEKMSNFLDVSQGFNFMNVSILLASGRIDVPHNRWPK